MSGIYIKTIKPSAVAAYSLNAELVLNQLETSVHCLSQADVKKD